MKTFDTQNTTAFNITISGPLSPYTYTVVTSFSSSEILSVNITFQSYMQGDDQEIFKIVFDQSQLKSLNGATLLNSELSAPVYKVPIVPDYIEPVGKGMDIVITVTIFAFITSNVLLKQSTELLWGFLNAIQIIYFFPLLQLYYPDNLAAFLSYFLSARLNFNIPYVDNLKNNLKQDVVSIQDSFEGKQRSPSPLGTVPPRELRLFV